MYMRASLYYCQVLILIQECPFCNRYFRSNRPRVLTVAGKVYDLEYPKQVQELYLLVVDMLVQNVTNNQWNHERCADEVGEIAAARRMKSVCCTLSSPLSHTTHIFPSCTCHPHPKPQPHTCMHTHTHACTHPHTRTHTQTYVHMHMNQWVYLCTV
jgi:hypothetical protein